LQALAPQLPSIARFERLDAVRIVAAVAVVWLHVPRSDTLTWTTMVCRFAVPFFAATVCFFALQSGLRSTEPFSKYARARLIKLYVPFLFWASVYLLFKGLKMIIAPEQENNFPGIEVLWTGGAYHLWFIPFALFTGLFAFAIGQTLQRVSREHWLTAAALTMVMAAWLALDSLPSSNWLIEPWNFMLDATPAAVLGMTMSILWQMRSDLWLLRGDRAASSFALLVFALTVILLFAFGRNAAIESIAGICLLMYALSTNISWLGKKMAPMGTAAMGIYFVHLLVLKVVESVTLKMQIPTNWSVDLLTFAVTLTGSFLLVRILSQFRITRWTVA
jgi:hypothetical protein